MGVYNGVISTPASECMCIFGIVRLNCAQQDMLMQSHHYVHWRLLRIHTFENIQRGYNIMFYSLMVQYT